jgi:hypothetical protein
MIQLNYHSHDADSLMDRCFVTMDLTMWWSQTQGNDHKIPPEERRVGEHILG